MDHDPSEEETTEILKIMREWGKEKAQSNSHQFAILNIFRSMDEARDENSYKYEDTRTALFDETTHRIYTVHAEAFLIGNPQRREKALKVPYKNSALAKIAEEKDLPLHFMHVYIYSNLEPCHFCKKAIQKSKIHFNIDKDVIVGYEIPGANSECGPLDGVYFRQVPRD